MLDLRRLAVLNEFAIHGSITATARSLGFSASAISQQLTTLERETGAVILERTARSATLTDAGRLLARHARLMLADSERAEAELAAQLERVGGSLTITTVPSLSAPVAAALAAVQRDHPDLELLMRQSASEAAGFAVADHESDIAVVDDWSARSGRAAEGLKRRKVFDEAIVLAVAATHPLTALGRPLTGADLAQAAPDMTWLCTPPGQPSRLAGDRRLTEAGARPRRRWEFEGLRTIAELVSTGTGCALLPELVAATHPRDVRGLPLSPAMARRVHLLTRASVGASPAVAACLAALTETLRRALEAARTQAAGPRSTGSASTP